ncbi:cytochrome-c peroxidase [Paracidovorax cattleyae]|nr:cytochrome c peroxidase [Paracidovorax cattleyae]
MTSPARMFPASRRFLRWSGPACVLAAAGVLAGLGVWMRGAAASGVAPVAARPAASSGAAPPDANRMQMAAQPDFARMQAVGQAMFFDQGLSASGRVSCASCHDPAHAFGPPNGLAVQPGGADGAALGVRAAPSLRYQQNVPPFTMHRFDDDFDESVDQGASGGHTWDGRASTLHEQAAIPLLAPHEMANANPAAVVKRLRRAPYAAQFRQTFGADALDDDARGFQWATLALEMFQQDPARFYPYSSRYDDYLRGKRALSAREMRGLALFNDAKKGNCASCHLSEVSPNNGAFPAFSDFGHIAIGVPRNRMLPANRDPSFHDLGTCATLPAGTDGKEREALCGAFRTPSLRNAAVRQAFFHNGVVHSLEEAVRFYATRDTDPQRWYPYPPRARGAHPRYDDLPAEYAGNVNREAPFDREPGEAPRLTEAEIGDVVAFLRTLTDQDAVPAMEAVARGGRRSAVARAGAGARGAAAAH